MALPIPDKAESSQTILDFYCIFHTGILYAFSAHGNGEAPKHPAGQRLDATALVSTTAGEESVYYA